MHDEHQTDRHQIQRDIHRSIQEEAEVWREWRTYERDVASQKPPEKRYVTIPKGILWIVVMVFIYGVYRLVRWFF